MYVLQTHLSHEWVPRLTTGILIDDTAIFEYILYLSLSTRYVTGILMVLSHLPT